MTFERFSEIWDMLIKMPDAKEIVFSTGMSQHTMNALIKYANGDKSEVEKIREALRRNKS